MLLMYLALADVLVLSDFGTPCVSRCKQSPGEKTIKITVKRPAALTKFGGEWVKAYEKDSWKNITNEYAALRKRDAHG